MTSPATKNCATVFVIDDDKAVRESLDSLIRSVGLSVQTFGSVQDFLEHPLPEIPICLVLDVRMPGQSGLELQRKLVATERPVPIIFITAHGDIPMSVSAMKAGAVEFLTKPFRNQDLLDAIHLAIARDQIALAHRAELSELRSRYESVSAREREVMGLILAGLLNKQIAARLGTTETTVKVQRSSLMKKMKVGSVAELVRIADKLGLEPSP
jgi:FixJ family two-component response regulator